MSDFLDQPATQTGFAQLIGMSQQAVSKQVEKGVLLPGKTNREWLHDYCDRLRDEAAGRGGDEQATLTKSRTREAQANAQLKELQFHKEVGDLIPASEIEPLLDSWAVTARSETTHAVEKIIAAIQSQHGIEVEQDLIDEQLGAAFTAIADYPRQLAGDADAGGQEVGATA